jgi:hypothetical protein
LENLRKIKIEGVMLRSKCRYEELGEKPSRYFFNLEKRNYLNKSISKLVDEDNNEYKNVKEILKYQKHYYEHLYTETNIFDDFPLENIIGENPKKLTEFQINSLEGEISIDELNLALSNMKNDKSPGLDGYTTEFFKYFWKDLAKFVLGSLNYAYRHGNLSVTQVQAVITCLPKPGKDRTFLKNWRPISLLNVVYKLASSVIANRLKKILNEIIHNDQKGFIAGRFIGENLRLVYDILFESKIQNIEGLLLSIDFKQAFDSISWKFIHKVLNFYKFGNSFKRWIALFQK